MHSQESYPLPEDPALAQVAAVLRDAEHWAWIFDQPMAVGTGAPSLPNDKRRRRWRLS